MRYYIWTIGCQMNKAESERLASGLEARGYQPAEAVEAADLILLNSCVVRQSAEARVINKLDALRALKKARPALTIGVTGCLVDSDTEYLRQRFPHVDYFFKAGEHPPLPDWQDYLPRPSPSTFVPIMQGCNNFCAYCIVPYRRGREQSRPVSEVVCEVRELVRWGTREAVLLGQNVDSYGHDLPGKPDLADLLGELNNIDGLTRIRFLTNHPKDMSLRLIQATARLDKVCEQISLPVQSGDDEILKIMGRGYTTEHYRRLVARLREGVSGVALSTDVIVGFPSETEAQFRNTLGLLGELKFDTVHVAAYSPRAGTLAARTLQDDIPLAEKKARLNQVEQLQERISTGINAGLLGQTVEVLVEGREKGKWRGRTRTDKLVFFKGSKDCLGELVNVTIEKTSPWSLQGRVEPDATK